MRAAQCSEETALLDQEAVAYIEMCCKGEELTPEKGKQIAKQGDKMLAAAGGVAAAMQALRQAREATKGNPLKGTLDEKLGMWLREEHWEYLKRATEEGVPSRRKAPKFRLKSKPHASAKEHIREVFEKAWGDTKYGVVLWCTEAAEEFTPDLMEAPTGRVPKMLPDRTLSSEGRIIHDMRLQSADGAKEDHPVALQPRDRQIARWSLWWRARHPKVAQVCAKRDVNRAFKWHHLRADDAGEFGTSLPGETLGVQGKVLLIYGVMVFGWSGSPG